MHGMTAWLDPLREALDESNTFIDFFFRDDDIGWATGEFRALLACFRRYSVPLDLAAIPNVLTSELADEICTLHAQSPALLGVHRDAGWHRHGPRSVRQRRRWKLFTTLRTENTLT